MKHIAFFLSAQTLPPSYTKPSLKLVELAVQEGYGFIYGGTNVGLMNQSAELVHSLNGHVTAIASKEFVKKLRKDAHETYIGKNLNERKRLFYEKADSFITLPGGTGTLDEITDIIAKKKVGLHNKPIAFLNTKGFWNSLIRQINRMHREKFAPYSFEEMCFASDDPKKIIQYIKTH